MILDAHGNEVEPAALGAPREACPRCDEIADRTLTTGFGGHWRVNCRCGEVTLSGRGDPPREGEY